MRITYNILRYYLNSLIALGVFVTSLAVSLIAYAHIREDFKSRRFALNSIPYGVYHFYLFQDGNCLGSLKTSLSRKNYYSLTLDGDMGFIYEEKPFRVNFQGQSLLNPLGQLVQTHAEMKVGALSVALNTEKVDPIEATFVTTVHKRTRTHKLNFPGPILLEPESKKTFSLSFPFQGDDNSPLSPLTAKLQKQLALQVKRSRKEKKDMQCNSHFLDLDHSLKTLKLPIFKWPFLNFFTNEVK